VVLITIYILWLVGIGFLAARKRRGVVRWVFFGLFLLLPATVVLLCLPPARMRACLYCAEKMKVEANVCPHCTRPQYVPAIAQGGFPLDWATAESPEFLQISPRPYPQRLGTQSMSMRPSLGSQQPGSRQLPPDPQQWPRKGTAYLGALPSRSQGPLPTVGSATARCVVVPAERIPRCTVYTTLTDRQSQPVLAALAPAAHGCGDDRRWDTMSRLCQAHCDLTRSPTNSPGTAIVGALAPGLAVALFARYGGDAQPAATAAACHGTIQLNRA
jgi:hypothetical protein